MAKENPPTAEIESDQPPEILNDFLFKFGLVLATWAQVEEALGMNFQRLTLMPPTRARLLFYSGRNFMTRADLYSAAVRAITLPPDRMAAHRALIKKARKYSSARNSIAHGLPVNLFGGGPPEGLRIKQGQKAWEPGGISTVEIMTAATNFQNLKRAADNLMWSRDDDLEAAQSVLELVRALPNEAFPREAALSSGEGE